MMKTDSNIIYVIYVCVLQCIKMAKTDNTIIYVIYVCVLQCIKMMKTDSNIIIYVICVCVLQCIKMMKTDSNIIIYVICVCTSVYKVTSALLCQFCFSCNSFQVLEGDCSSFLADSDIKATTRYGLN